MGKDEASANPHTTDGRTDTKATRRTWERPGEPTVAIVEAVGSARNCGPTDLPPLHDYVDTDALESLLAGARARSEDLSLTFEYDGWEVVVESATSTSVRVSGTGSD